jgi:hypothetical protein
LRRTTLRLLAVLSIGCGTAGLAVNPDETSVDGHRVEAARERAAAAHEITSLPAMERGDPAPRPAWQAASTTDLDSPAARAQRRLAHAAAHEEAAELLERFEANECRGVPGRERAACPILGPVRAVVEIPGGVRVELTPAADVAAVVARMRCHYAFARARGFTRDAAACPLYLAGIRISRASEAQAVDIIARSARQADELRGRVLQEVVPAP